MSETFPKLLKSLYSIQKIVISNTYIINLPNVSLVTLPNSYVEELSLTLLWCYICTSIYLFGDYSNVT